MAIVPTGNLSSAADVLAYNYTGTAALLATYAALGPRLYVAVWNLTATSDVKLISNAIVVSKVGSNLVGDSIIPGPNSYAPAGGPITQPGAGTVTAGLH